uniref:C2H2-type domain-containing protein n=1 Tax=Panagrellus redivivus TaxID=6233 RepID=A0A7E4UQL3_PANRE
MSVQCKNCDSPPIFGLAPFLDHMKKSHFPFSDAKYQYKCPACPKSCGKKNFCRHFETVHGNLFAAAKAHSVNPPEDRYEELPAAADYDVSLDDCSDLFEDLTEDSQPFADSHVNDAYTKLADQLSSSSINDAVSQVFSTCESFFHDLLARPDMTIKLGAQIHGQFMATITSVSEVFKPYVDSQTFGTIADKINAEIAKRNSQYLLTQNFKSRANYISPQACAISYRREVRARKAVEPTIETKSNNLAWIPIRESLLRVFESSSITDSLLFTSTCINAHPDHPMAAGRARAVFEDLNHRDSIMLQLYIDDYGTANPLGYAASTNKIVGCYFRILNLPSKLQTADSIFLCFLALKNDFSNLQTVIRTVLLPQLISLESEGITITVKGEEKHFPVILHSIVGDNAGLHELSNLVMSWMGCSPCRFCKLTYAEVKTTHTLLPSKAKTKEWYEAVLKKPPTEWTKHGISGQCALNDLKYFHTMDSQCVDLMHDLLEGHIRCLLATVAQFLADDGFSVAALNSAIAMFPFAGSMLDSKPGQVYPQDVKDGELKHSTASKTLNLCQMLPLILQAAGYTIDPDHDVWRTFLLFLDILDILLATRITTTMLSTFETKVKEYLSLFIEIGGKMTVKPHYLLHYADVIRNHGPVVHHWCMRYEAKHKVFKQYARVNFNRQDLAMTLAKKHALLAMKAFDTLQNPNYMELHDQRTARRLYKKNLVVVYDIHENTQLPMFGKILSANYDTRMLQIEILRTVEFSTLHHAFRVQQQPFDVRQVHADELITHHAFPIYLENFVCLSSVLVK